MQQSVENIPRIISNIKYVKNAYHVPKAVVFDTQVVKRLWFYYVERLLELTGSQCRSCPLQCTITTRVVECALVMKMKCSAGHVFTWSYSLVIRNAN